MIGLREFELRLLDDRNRVVLVIPMIAGSQEEALRAARAHMRTHAAVNFALLPQLSSVGFSRLDAESANGEADIRYLGEGIPHA